MVRNVIFLADGQGDGALGDIDDCKAGQENARSTAETTLGEDDRVPWARIRREIRVLQEIRVYFERVAVGLAEGEAVSAGVGLAVVGCVGGAVDLVVEGAVHALWDAVEGDYKSVEEYAWRGGAGGCVLV